MIKNILGGLLAIILGMLVVRFTISYSQRLYEIPEGLDAADPDDRAIVVAAVTKEAKTMLISGHMIAAFLSGFIAAKISSHAKLGTGMIASMVILIGTITMVIMMGFPWGFSSLLVFATLFAAYAGSRVGSGGQVYIED